MAVSMAKGKRTLGKPRPCNNFQEECEWIIFPSLNTHTLTHTYIYNLGLDMNGTHQVLAYTDDVNLICDDIRTIERSADVLLNACKDIGLAVNTGKTNYMAIGRHRGMMANAHIKIGSYFYEKVKNFKFLGSLLTNQSFFKEEIKCRLKAGNSCYYSVQTLLSFRLLTKNLKTKIYKTIILPVVLYGCET